jgi:hypothetical protein
MKISRRYVYMAIFIDICVLRAFSTFSLCRYEPGSCLDRKKHHFSAHRKVVHKMQALFGHLRPGMDSGLRQKLKNC